MLSNLSNILASSMGRTFSKHRFQHVLCRERLPLQGQTTNWQLTHMRGHALILSSFEHQLLAVANYTQLTSSTNCNIFLYDVLQTALAKLALEVRYPKSARNLSDSALIEANEEMQL